MRPGCVARARGVLARHRVAHQHQDLVTERHGVDRLPLGGAAERRRRAAARRCRRRSGRRRRPRGDRAVRRPPRPRARRRRWCRPRSRGGRLVVGRRRGSGIRASSPVRPTTATVAQHRGGGDGGRRHAEGAGEAPAAAVAEAAGEVGPAGHAVGVAGRGGRGAAARPCQSWEISWSRTVWRRTSAREVRLLTVPSGMRRTAATSATGRSRGTAAPARPGRWR